MARTIRTFSNDKMLVKERRSEIISGAIEVFLKKGYEETTMAEIAKACNMSKGLLYHYVSSKDDILYLIAYDQAEGTRRGFGTLRDRCEKMSPTEALLEYIRFYYQIVHNTQDYQVFLNQVVAKLPRADRQILFDTDNYARDILDAILKRGVESGEFEIEDTVLMAHNILMIGRVWADRRWFLQKNYTLEYYMKAQIKHILKSILPNKDGAGRISDILSDS